NDEETRRAAQSILAHEIGHLLEGHIQNDSCELADLGAGSMDVTSYSKTQQEELRRQELEADEFSGGVMYMLGSEQHEAGAALRRYATANQTCGHPARNMRLVAVRRGWHAARDREDLPQRKRDYAATMALVARAINQRDTLRAQTQLERLLPRPGSTDVRTFAWYHYWRMLHPEEDTIEITPEDREAAWQIEAIVPIPGTTRIAIAATNPSSSTGAIEVHDIALSHAPRVARWRFSTNVLGVAPDGSWLVHRRITGAYGSSWLFGIQLLNVATGAMTPFEGGHHAFIDSLAVSPDGRYVATGAADGTVAVWDVAAKTMIVQALHHDRVSAVAFSRDSRFAFSAGADRRLVISTVANLSLVREVNPDLGDIAALTTSPDGMTLVTAGGRGVAFIDVRDPLAGVTARPVMEGETNAVRFSPDGNVLAVASQAAVVTLLDPMSQHAIAEIHGHVGSVDALAFSIDGVMLLTGDHGFSFAFEGPAPVNGVVRKIRWQTADAVARKAFPAIANSRIAIVNPDAGLFGAVSPTDSGTLNVWNTVDNAVHEYVIGGSVSAAAFSPDGRYVAVGNSATIESPSSGGLTRIWDCQRAEHVVDLDPHDQYISDIDFRTDTIATASCDRIRTWLLHFGEKRAELRADIIDTPGCLEMPVADAIAVTPDASGVVAVAHRNPSVSIWNAQDGSLLRRFTRSDSNGAESVAISRDATMLAEGNVDWNVHLWSLARDRAALVLGGLDQPPKGLTFSPDGSLLAAGAGPRDPILLWETGIGLLVGELSAPGGDVTKLYFASDGTLCAATVGLSIATLVTYRVASDAMVRDGLTARFEANPALYNREILLAALWAAGHDARLDRQTRLAMLARADDLVVKAPDAQRASDQYLSWREEIDFATRTLNTEVEAAKMDQIPEVRHEVAH
ncbi:MAG: hypothetical protein AABP62_31295, partial [Planctomycetota bacterium]